MTNVLQDEATEADSKSGLPMVREQLSALTPPITSI
jgi:hypothetical protein